MLIYILLFSLAIFSLSMSLYRYKLREEHIRLDKKLQEKYDKVLDESNKIIKEIETSVSGKIETLVKNLSEVSDDKRAILELDELDVKEEAIEFIESLNMSQKEIIDSNNTLEEKYVKLELFNIYVKILLEKLYEEPTEDSVVS